MPVKLTQKFASNGGVDGYDVIQMKKTLNRLGYYMPYEAVGITDIPDAEIFDALKRFQKNHGLRPGGDAYPDDETVRALNEESAETPDGYYVWRTVEDGKARKAHAQYSRTIRAWSDSPDPGEDYNCRCWAERIDVPENIRSSLEYVLDRLSEFDENKYTLAAQLLRHYLGRTGEKVVLPPAQFDQSPVVQEAIEKNRNRFEDDFLGRIKTKQLNSFNPMILNLPDGKTVEMSDYWDIDRPKSDLDVLKDSDFARAIGSAKIRSSGRFTARRNGGKITVTGKVTHEIGDIYDFNAGLIDGTIFRNERKLVEYGYAKPFKVEWRKEETFEGTIHVQDGSIVGHGFKWVDGPP